MRLASPLVPNVGTFGRADLSGWQRFPNNLPLARFSGLLENAATNGRRPIEHRVILPSEFSPH
ncbi:MAG: hypothetical protein K9I74_10965 [Bacteroidales bacterium]|nr:hypothetical protein [Bacteroidales bacterium]